MSVAISEKKFNIRKPPARIFSLDVDCSEKVPNSETLAAMQEVEDMINGNVPRRHQSVESLFEELGINVHR